MLRLTYCGYILLLASSLVFTGCKNNKYEVTERSQKEVPNYKQPGTHTEVQYVLMHDGHKIYATCDADEISSLDPNARCGFRPLQTYECVLSDGKVDTAKLPLSDLKCKDADGHNVYLYVDKKE